MKQHKRTDRRFLSLDRLRDALPRGMSFIETKGLKTGEAWFRIRQRGMCAWAVVDAFGGATGKTCSRPEMLETFPRFGVGDPEVYKGWVLKRIATDQPTLVVPCHGALFRGAGLPARLDALVRKSL